MSPVLLRRKALKEKSDQDALSVSNASASTAQSFGISEFLQMATLLRPSPHPHPHTMSAVSPAPVTPAGPPTLLPERSSAGATLVLSEFCTLFDVSTTVHDKLLHEGFTSSRTLQYLTLPDLKEMGFKYGEIASIKDAVARWSVPAAVE